MDISAITYSVFIPLLNQIHDLGRSIGLESFGWSIVLLTALIKLLLTPLTFKQIKSTKKMQVVQPKLKKMQDDFKKQEERLKDKPEQLQKARMEFQQKMMGFYQENDVNPLGGCLPLIIQMPILLGLFWTFSGPPFQSKPIHVDVKVVKASEAHKKEIKSAKTGEIFVDANGKRARIALNTKGVTLVEGETFDFTPKKTMGDASFNPKNIVWNFFGDKTENEHVDIAVNPDGSATVTAISPGSAKVQAKLPATLRNDHFFFIDDFGASGVFDKNGNFNLGVFILVSIFAASIWLSSKLNAPKLPETKPGEVEDPQVAMQRSMSTMMPVMMGGMMFFIPIPVGALLYMVVSSVIQAGQTYFAMQRYNAKFGH